MDKKHELLELYKIIIDSATNNENKRLQTNTMYTTIIVAIIAFIGTQHANTIVMSLICLVLSSVWYIHIHAYRRLAQAKFKVINELEKQLIYKIFEEEWKFYKKTTPFIEQTLVEKVLPLLTGLLSIVIILCKLYELFLPI